MYCFVRSLSLSAYSYVMKAFVITVNRLLTESPVLTNMHVLSTRSFRGYEKYELLRKRFSMFLLAEEAAIPNKNRTN